MGANGAGGCVVAKELITAGMSVVLFEQGGWVSYDDNTEDKLHSERNPVLGNSSGPDDKRYLRVNVHPDGSTHTVLPSEGDYNNISAFVGSGTVTYGALAWRYMREDFKMKTTYGEVPGSTLAEWPITYDDLEPYYEKVEWEIGVSGDDSKNPFAPPRKKLRMYENTMNTSFADRKSPNNIHWVSCINCHPKGRPGTN